MVKPRTALFLLVLFLVPSIGIAKISDEQKLEDLWYDVKSTFSESVSVRNQNHITVSKQQLKVALARKIPGFDETLNRIVKHLKQLKMKKIDGKMHVLVELDVEELVFDYLKKKKAKTGQVYSTVFSKNFGFSVFMNKDLIVIDQLYGFKGLVKIPLLPDSIYPERFDINTEELVLKVMAKTLWKAVKVSGEVDLRKKKFKGVNWWESIVINWRRIWKSVKLKLAFAS